MAGHMRRRFRIAVVIGFASALIFGIALGIQDIRVRIAMRLIPICPTKFIGKRFSLDTKDSFSSAYGLADLCDSIYGSYKDRLTPTPKTYFWLIASMDTQATVWQFDDYYIHLYATSDMGRDIVSVAVVPGHYEKTQHSDDGVHDIAYVSPKRFFVPNR